MTYSDTALRLWDALCEMRAASDVLIKDQFCRRVDEVLAAEEASVEIKPPPDVVTIGKWVIPAGTLGPDGTITITGDTIADLFKGKEQ